MDKATGGTDAAVKPIISFRNVCKRWGSTVGVDNVSLDIMRHYRAVIIRQCGCAALTYNK